MTSIADRPDGSTEAGTAIFSDVLCAIDGTHESVAAVEHAAALAGPGGQITLLVVTSYEEDGDRRSPAIGPGRAKSMLDRAVEICGEAGVACTVEVDPASPPSEVVLDWSVGRGLLALGGPATSWFGGMFAGGVAVNAEGAFITPLLIARSRPADSALDGPVVVASDGLEGSDELVELAGRMARAQGSSAVLLHVLGAESAARPHRIEHQARTLERAMQGAFEERIEVGHPHGDRRGRLRRGASLVVMSSRRLQGLRVVGSVSRRVVHQGHCSVCWGLPSTCCAERGGLDVTTAAASPGVRPRKAEAGHGESLRTGMWARADASLAVRRVASHTMLLLLLPLLWLAVAVVMAACRAASIADRASIGSPRATPWATGRPRRPRTGSAAAPSTAARPRPPAGTAVGPGLSPDRPGAGIPADGQPRRDRKRRDRGADLEGVGGGGGRAQRAAVAGEASTRCPRSSATTPEGRRSSRRRTTSASRRIKARVRFRYEGPGRLSWIRRRAT